MAFKWCLSGVFSDLLVGVVVWLVTLVSGVGLGKGGNRHSDQCGRRRCVERSLMKEVNEAVQYYGAKMENGVT